MDGQLASFLEDLFERGRAHDALRADRLERWRNLEPETARLLALLVRALAPRKVLELGTSNGYSTIWLADAAHSCGGSLTSVEVDHDRSQAARENLRAAGLEGEVVLMVDDAASVLGASDEGEWGFIFLDAERDAYISYWSDLVRVLPPRGMLVVDNALSHADELTEFRALVAADGRVVEALVPTGAGALLIVREAR
jgi:predicted O-methyltransferase YrrM